MKKLLLCMLALFSIKAYAMANNLQEQLTQAILDNNYELVEECINQGTDLNKPEDGCEEATPLNCAALRGNVEIAKLLIKNGAQVNVKIEDGSYTGGSSALHYACENGHVEMVKLLIDSKADLNKANNSNHTPLDNALAKNHLEIVHLLLEAGAKVDHQGKKRPGQNSRYRWPGPVLFSSSGVPGPLLGCAIMADKFDLVKLFIDKGADVNKPCFLVGSPLVGAYFIGNNKVINLLKAHEAKITEIDPHLLCLAASKGNRSSVEWLIQSGISLEGREELRQFGTPLYMAVDGGHKELCKILLAAGATSCVERNGLSVVDCARLKRNRIIFSLAEKWKEKAHLQTAQDVNDFNGLCAELKDYDEIVDILHSYQSNPLALRYQCINTIRKLVKEGELSKEELPCHLDEFGFGRLIIPKVNDDDNNNNEDEK